MTRQYSDKEMAAFKKAMRDPEFGPAVVDLALTAVDEDRITRHGAMTPATRQSLDRRADEASDRGHRALGRLFGGS